MTPSTTLRTGNISDFFRSIIELVSNPWFQEVGMLFVIGGIFISIAELALPTRLTQGRAGKVLVGSLGVGFTIALFSVKRAYNFSLAAFGFIANMIVILLFVFLFYYMLRKFEVKHIPAFCYTYTAGYLSLLLIQNTIFDSFAKSIPWLNGILTLLFILTLSYSVWHLFKQPFGGNSFDLKSKIKPKELFKDTEDPADVPEIEKEERDQKTETKQVKKEVMQITDLEIKTVNDVKGNLDRMIALVNERHGNFTDADASSISHVLQKITNDENILRRGLDRIKQATVDYETMHRKDLAVQRSRLEKSKNRKHRKLLQDLIEYEGKIESALQYIRNNEEKLIQFARSFNKQIQAALIDIKDHNTDRALIFLGYAKQNITRMKAIYEYERKLERYLINEGRRTLHALHNERKVVREN